VCECVRTSMRMCVCAFVPVIPRRSTERKDGTAQGSEGGKEMQSGKEKCLGTHYKCLTKRRVPVVALRKGGIWLKERSRCLLLLTSLWH